MERLFEAYQPGFHSYHPFRLNSTDDKPSLQTLQDWCKYTILRNVSLRDLKLKTKELPLPRPLIRYLQSFSTNDFDEVECAPLVDIFEFNFYHRAVTYKVRSKYDKCEYLATHGATQHDLSDPVKCKEKDAWINTNHENLMMIYGIVTDELTGNVFYIMNIPQVSLEHIQVMLFSSNLAVPELELWLLAYHLSSALLYIQSLGLCYGAFGLDNVFVIDNRIVLENELTRKSRMYLLSRFDEGMWSKVQRSSWQPQTTPVKVAETESFTPLQMNEAQSVWYLGFILSKFASTHAADSPLLFPIDVPQSFLFYKRWTAYESYKLYSSELCHLIINTQNPDFKEKPSLLWIQDLAKNMIKRLYHGEPNTELLYNGLLEMAKREYAVRKQLSWR